MKTFMKIVPWVLLALLLGAGVYIVNLKSKESKKEEKYEAMSNELDDFRKANRTLINDKEALNERNQILEDSITILNAQIDDLKRQLSRKVGEIKANKQRIASLQAKADKLQKELNDLRAVKNADKERIKELEDERFELDVKLGDLFLKNDSLETENSSLLENLVDKEKEKENIQGELTDTVKVEMPVESFLKVLDPEKIDVAFNEIVPITRTNKRAKSSKKWNATTMVFQLNYDGEGPDDLSGRDFMVQILDKKTGAILSPREASAGTQDTKGMLFTFARNPVSVQYVNYQKKEGDDYVIQLSYFNTQGQRMVLPSGTVPVKFDEE